MAVGIGPGVTLANRYRLVKQLGRGAVGNVWLAHDGQLDDEPVACKILNEVFNDDRRAIADLKREVLLTRRLRHPHIVAVYTFWECDSTRFITMEYVSGQNLSDLLLDRGEPLGLLEVLPWIEQVCLALDYAHQEQVLHRDIKPANVLLGDDRRIRLADFGIARTAREARSRLTGQSTSGTVMFMSPEQLMGEPLDHRSDLYSLATSIYELLNGTPPFHTGSIVAQIQIKTPSPIPSVPPGVNSVILRALAKDPHERQRSCGEFLAQLREAVLEERPQRASGIPAQSAAPNAATVQIRMPHVANRTARLGRILVESGLVNSTQLSDALMRQEATGRRLGDLLIEMGAVSDEDIARALADQLGIPFVRLDEENVDPAAAKLVPRTLAVEQGCLPIARSGDRVVVAVSDPLSFKAINELERQYQSVAELRVACESDILAATERIYEAG